MIQVSNQVKIYEVDGNPLNNRLDNLEYVTRSENILHAFRLGLHKPKIGEEVHNAKLKISYFPEIKRLRKSGWTDVKLAERYNVGETTMRRLFIGDSWAHSF